MKKYWIFDLDLTLVDTSAVELYRKNRNWGGAYAHLDQCRVYAGMDKVFEAIGRYGVNTCIVSTSPRPYVERVVSRFNLPIHYVVGYHDAKPIKPHPAPMLKAIELLGCRPEEAISFGDRAIDIRASNGAGIESVACFWGTKERRELSASGYSHAFTRPEEILNLLC